MQLIFSNLKVRNFALFATTQHFREIKQTGETRRMIQCFAVFKEIRNRWNYVNDQRREYIAYLQKVYNIFRVIVMTTLF